MQLPGKPSLTAKPTLEIGPFIPHFFTIAK